MRRALPLLVVIALAGCGGVARRAAAPQQPKLPRVLAQSWKQHADAVASALAAGDAVNLEVDLLAKYVERLLPSTMSR